MAPPPILLSSVLMCVVGLVVISTPRLYERNLVTIFLLSCAWILQEIQTITVVRGLILALLQGEACHRAVTSFNLQSSNVIWITAFALLQDDLVGIARLVGALALASFTFASVWNRALTDAIQTRSQSEYWNDSTEDDEPHRQQQQQQRRWRFLHQRRRDFGTVLQLVLTRRAYDLLSARSRAWSELQDAKQEFIRSGGTERGPRDRFTMTVFSAISRQGTATVIRSAEASQVRRYASRAAAFVERRFTVTALNRVESIFRPLPLGLDPAGGQSGWKTLVLLAVSLVAHKRAFQVVKQYFQELGDEDSTRKMALFLFKQLSRLFLVVYVLVRHALGYLRTADPILANSLAPRSRPPEGEETATTILGRDDSMMLNLSAVSTMNQDSNTRE